MLRIKLLVKEKMPSLFYWLHRLKSRHYKKLTTKEIFTEKFNNNMWHGEESISGPGSSLDNTHLIQKELPILLQSLGIKKMLDIPCGDFYWMNQIILPVEIYIGADIVEPLIAENQEKYNKPGYDFRNIDLLRDPLPKVDLIFCRDCLVHFSNSDIKLALKQMKESGSTYLLTTTFPDKKINMDILTGQWRPINLQIPPFSFPAPIQLLLKESTAKNSFWVDKSLGLWRLQTLDV